MELTEYFIKSQDLVILLVICLMATLIARYKKWLTFPACLLASIIAFAMLVTVPKGLLFFPFFFVLVGSLFSKLNEKEKRELDGRTIRQVFANAGWVLIILLINHFYPSVPEAFLIICNFAIAFSDTISSDIGRRFSKHSYDILSFRKMSSGPSGGVSLIGTFAGLIASIIIAWMALFFLAPILCIWVSIFGFVGMLVDSILGSYLQGKYMVVDQIKEKGKKSQLIRGYHWIDNDLINFMSIGITLLFASLLF